MDERTLRQLLSDTLVGEPPIGPIARNALRAGIRIRRRRTTGAVSGVAAIAAIAGVLPAVVGLPHSGPGGRPVVHSQAKGIGGFRDRPVQVTFSPDGKVLATADSDGSARFWNVATQRQIGAPIKLSGVHVMDVAYRPDGKALATADSDGTVRLWNVATHRQIGAPIAAAGAGIKVESVAFSPSGKLLATATRAGSVRIWNVATGHQSGAAITIPSVFIATVEFSPNGKLLLTTDSGSSARFWSVASHREVGKPIGRQSHDEVLNAVFSPDGKLIGTSGIGFGSDRVWNVATEKQVGKTMHTGYSDSYGVAFTPDSKVLVTSCTDGTIRQWSVATSKQIRPAIAPSGRNVFGVEALSPDGKILATTKFDGNAQLWVLSKA
jgi:WD40 repeat protein